jgi:hypothetical protein
MKPTQANSWERLQQNIDAEVESLEESIRALKESIRALNLRRNAHSPISSLPPEVFAAIFSFACLPGIPSLGGKLDHNLARIHLSHVCHQWREIALNQPLLWSHVDFTTLSLAGATEMLVRAKSVPLYLEAKRASWRCWESRWDGDQFRTFRTELRACIPQTCHLSINAKPYHLRSTVEKLVSPAPTLEYLSLFSRAVSNGRIGRTWDERDEVFIPDALFEGAAPRLSCLKLRDCNISWKSPLLKGLKYLQILTLSEHARPKLAVWLDALNEMPQLKMLTLHSASPIAPSFPFDVERTVTLSSLTHLDISASVTDCALALAHLELPALTWLCLILISYQNDNSLQGVLPYVARHAHGPQDIQPLQSLLVRNRDYLDRLGNRLDILAWPVPDIDVEVQVHDSPALLGATVPTRLAMSFRSENWQSDAAHPEILNAMMTALPLDNLVMLSAQDLDLTDYHHTSAHQDLSRQQLWLRHLPKWPLLRRVRLGPYVKRGFIETLLEDDGGRENPILPSLTELVLVKSELHASWARCLCDALTKRMEQGVPLGILDLSAYDRSPDDPTEVRLLSEVVVDVLAPNFMLGPEENLDAAAQKSRRMTRLWDNLVRGPFAEDENTDEEDEDNY